MPTRNTDLQIVLITGMSGSGKSVALHALEDAGFYCVDNLPPELLLPFVALEQEHQASRVAIAMDVRSAKSLPLVPLQLAALHGDRFSGFIAIEASDFQPAWYDIDWFHRPDAHGGEMGAALVSANISPHAPDAERWNTLWMFMQSGPGVFRGDLSFYTRDDSLIARLARIDTTRTPVHLLVGAYDLTCTPEDARRTAAAIPGATCTVMDELGHFPMSEHPAGFRPFFADALARMKLPAEV